MEHTLDMTRSMDKTMARTTMGRIMVRAMGPKLHAAQDVLSSNMEAAQEDMLLDMRGMDSSNYKQEDVDAEGMGDVEDMGDVEV